MTHLSPVEAGALTWLLESDTANPGVRYFALADLLDRPAGDPELVAARQSVMSSGPVSAILDAQCPEGCGAWAGSGPPQAGCAGPLEDGVHLQR